MGLLCHAACGVGWSQAPSWWLLLHDLGREMLGLVGLGASSHIRVMARSWEQRGVGGREDEVALLLCSGSQPVPAPCSYPYAPVRVFSVSFSSPLSPSPAPSGRSLGKWLSVEHQRCWSLVRPAPGSPRWLSPAGSCTAVRAWDRALPTAWVGHLEHCSPGSRTVCREP